MGSTPIRVTSASSVQALLHFLQALLIYPTKYNAAKREKQLKGWSHAKKQLLIDGKLGINACTEIVEEIIRD